MITMKNEWIRNLLFFGMALIVALCLQPTTALATNDGDETAIPAQDTYAEDYEAFRDQDIEYSEATEGSGSTAYYLIIPDPGTTTAEIIPDENPSMLPQTGDGLWIAIICLGIAAACACVALVLGRRSSHITIPKGPAKRPSVRKSK